jgi:hypothetical protein
MEGLHASGASARPSYASRLARLRNLVRLRTASTDLRTVLAVVKHDRIRSAWTVPALRHKSHGMSSILPCREEEARVRITVNE